MTRDMNKATLSVLCAFVVFMVFGCGFKMHSPSEINQNRVEVREIKFEQLYSISSLSAAKLKSISDDYYRYGDGWVDVAVLYDQRSNKMTAMEAMRQSSRVSNELRLFGVRDVRVSILPVKNYSDDDNVMVSYNRYSASKPKNCGSMIGFDGGELNAAKIDRNRGYKYGCEIEGLFAKQVARPKDLLGNDKLSPADGRRLSNMHETYRDSMPNKPLSGELASE